MVAVEPAQLWRLSFQLSFAASLALATVIPGLPWSGPGAWLVTAPVAAIAAQLATLPVLLPIFGTISLVSLPANVLIGPLVGLAFLLAALAAPLALLWYPLGEAIAMPARLCAGVVLVILDRLGGAEATLATVGETSGSAASLVTLLAAAAVLALSRDGRRWAARLPAAARARISGGACAASPAPGRASGRPCRRSARSGR
jgi:competence protein ComEC